MKKSLVLLALFLFSLCPAAFAQSLVTYPAPEGLQPIGDFAVKVRTPGGAWQDLYTYRVEVDMRRVTPASMVYFDCAGPVEVRVQRKGGKIDTARVRPLSYGITPAISGDTLTFTLDKPQKVSVEVNGDDHGNLHVFANPLETDRPDPKDPNVIYFGPGLHKPGTAGRAGNTLRIPSGKTVYLAGGAVVQARLLCDHVENVTIRGRGVLLQPDRGVEVTFSNNVTIDGITVINPAHYTVLGGQSITITIRNLKAFSCKQWSDGIDMMSCSNVLIDGVFLRNSDDCIAIYNHRWNYYGDSRNWRVMNSTLWADVAHPINIGCHGIGTAGETPEVIEDLAFTNLDVLEHREPSSAYQGCMALNPGDKNIVRNVRFENIRAEDFAVGQLVNLRVTYNSAYNTAPGGGIENIYFKDIRYNGTRAGASIINGYDAARQVRGVTFENLRINGKLILDAAAGNIKAGRFAGPVAFKPPAAPAPASAPAR